MLALPRSRWRPYFHKANQILLKAMTSVLGHKQKWCSHSTVAGVSFPVRVVLSNLWTWTWTHNLSCTWACRANKQGFTWDTAACKHTCKCHPVRFWCGPYSSVLLTNTRLSSKSKLSCCESNTEHTSSQMRSKWAFVLLAIHLKNTFFLPQNWVTKHEFSWTHRMSGEQP